jgi:hypothetical protein
MDFMEEAETHPNSAEAIVSTLGMVLAMRPNGTEAAFVFHDAWLVTALGQLADDQNRALLTIVDRFPSEPHFAVLVRCSSRPRWRRQRRRAARDVDPS